VDGWTERTRAGANGTVERYRERPVPGQPGTVEHWYYAADPFARLEVRSRPTPRASSTTAASPWLSVEISERALEQIKRELNECWDGREHGGALAGWIDGGRRLVIERAGGLGIGVETPRAKSWIKAPVTRYHDFAVAHGLELVGDWHSHSESTSASPGDRKVWSNLRAALDIPVLVGLIVLPHKVTVRGLAFDQDAIRWSCTAYLCTPDGCDLVIPTFTP